MERTWRNSDKRALVRMQRWLRWLESGNYSEMVGCRTKVKNGFVVLRRLADRTKVKNGFLEVICLNWGHTKTVSVTTPVFVKKKCGFTTLHFPNVLNWEKCILYWVNRPLIKLIKECLSHSKACDCVVKKVEPLVRL